MEVHQIKLDELLQGKQEVDIEVCVRKFGVDLLQSSLDFLHHRFAFV